MNFGSLCFCSNAPSLILTFLSPSALLGAATAYSLFSPSPSALRRLLALWTLFAVFDLETTFGAADLSMTVSRAPKQLLLLLSLWLVLPVIDGGGFLMEFLLAPGVRYVSAFLSLDEIDSGASRLPLLRRCALGLTRPLSLLCLSF